MKVLFSVGDTVLVISQPSNNLHVGGIVGRKFEVDSIDEDGLISIRGKHGSGRVPVECLRKVVTK